jgi:hypothetical protein
MLSIGTAFYFTAANVTTLSIRIIPYSGRTIFSTSASDQLGMYSYTDNYALAWQTGQQKNVVVTLASNTSPTGVWTYQYLPFDTNTSSRSAIQYN